MQKTVDGFVYGHMPLYHDLSYIAQYMHEDYQKEILDLIHTMVTFHKIAVQFPNTTPLEANKLSFDGAFQKIKQNFFDIPNPHKGELYRVQMLRIPHVTKCLFKITSIPQHIIKNRRWVKEADDN